MTSFHSFIAKPRSLPAEVLLALAGLCLPAAAQGRPSADDREAEAFVDTLYGNRIDKVQRTREAEDDLELMREMLDIAPTLPTSPDTRSALYARIAMMTAKSRTGYEVAIQALDALAEHNPRHPKADQQTRLDLFSIWYRAADRDARQAIAERYFDELVDAADAALRDGEAGDAKRWYNEAGSVMRVNRLEREFDLRDKLLEVRAVERIEQEARQLSAAADAGTLSMDNARRLTVLLALEMGRFREAQRYARLTGDDTFARGVQAAADLGGLKLDPRGNDLADAPTIRWYDAGHWFASLVDEPRLTDRAAARAVTLGRDALGYFIDHTGKEDVNKARATIMLRQLDERIAELSAPDSRAYSLIKALDPQKHLDYGKPFETRDGKLYMNSDSIIHLPIEGGDWYALTMQVQLAAPREEGMLVWFPVAGRMGRMIIDASDDHGTRVDGLDYIDDPKGVIRLSESAQATLRLEVKSISEKEAAIALDFNGKRVWEWKGAVADLDDPPRQPADTRQFAIRVHTDSVFQRLELERLKPKDE